MVSAASYDCHVESVDDLPTYVHVMDLWIMYSAPYSLCGTINFIMYMVCARSTSTHVSSIWSQEYKKTATCSRCARGLEFRSARPHIM